MNDRQRILAVVDGRDIWLTGEEIERLQACGVPVDPPRSWGGDSEQEVHPWEQLRHAARSLGLARADFDEHGVVLRYQLHEGATS